MAAQASIRDMLPAVGYMQPDIPVDVVIVQVSTPVVCKITRLVGEVKGDTCSGREEARLF